VQALLAAGSDVEEPAADGDAPLHKAAIAGHLATVQLLKTRSQVRLLPAAGAPAVFAHFTADQPTWQKCVVPSANLHWPFFLFQLPPLPCPAAAAA
jgi:ankyrin repeat protein